MTESVANLPADRTVDALQAIIANPTADSLEANLDRVKAALAAAQDDFQRIQIRKGAAAVAAAAAAILERSDIQVSASELVQRAERAIHNANPPGKRGRGNKIVIPNHVYTAATLRQIRAAHTHIPDAVFEAACADARESATPLTRQALKAITKVSRHAAQVANTTPATLPEGVYDCIVVDPPWQYPDSKYNPNYWQGRMDPDFPTMDTRSIAAIDLPLAADSVVWLWTTHRYLPHAFYILERWELQYRHTLTWHKTNRTGTGHYLRCTTEFVLMAIRGKPAVLRTTQGTLLQAKAREPSRKPDERVQIFQSVNPANLPFSRCCVVAGFGIRTPAAPVRGRFAATLHRSGLTSTRHGM